MANLVIAQVDSIGAVTYDTLALVDPVIPASFPGGEPAMWEFLGRNLRHPGICAEGRVYIGFTVEPDGVLSNLHLKRGVAKVLDDEALRVVASMPKWQPATLEGKAIRAEYVMPVVFRMR